MKFFLLAFSLIAAPAEAKSLSLFYQTEAEIVAANPAPCADNEIALKLKNLKSYCGQPLSAWRRYSMALIDVPGDRGNNDFGDFQEIVARNTRISEAYALLYLQSRDSVPACGRSLLSWLGGGSLGSLKSGGVMRSGLSSDAAGIARFDDVEDSNYRGRFIEMFGIMGDKALDQAARTLGKGNREIFKDLFWQLLAGSTCGAAEVVRTIEAEPSWRQDEKLNLAHKSWTEMTEAERTCDPAQVTAANNHLVDVEQRLVAQPTMYDSLQSQLGGWVLGKIGDAAVPTALGTFESFMTHASRQRPIWATNFANPDQRIAWMKDQLATMEQAFQAKKDFTEHLFCAVANESENTRKFLKEWKAPEKRW